VLLPRRCQGIVLADRGFAETDLIAQLGHRGWPWRRRIKRRCWRARRGWRRWKVERLAVARGQACFWPQVSIPAKPYGPVYLAVAHAWQGQDAWDVLRDAPTARKPFQEYSLRCEIEENCLDDKSNGCPVESSLMRSAPALTRLCLGLAMTTLYLVSQGVEVVQQGTRRGVAPHGLRGQSYWKIGWHWVQWALSRGMDLITTMHWSSDCAPAPAMASKRQ
jgi:hypothetical protein